MRRAALVLAALAALAVSPRTARAEEDLADINDRLLVTMKSLPLALGQTETSDDEAVKRLEATIKWAKPKLEDFKDDERYPGVADNVKSLEAELSSIRAGHKAFLALHEVGLKHQAGQTVGDPQVKGMAAAVADFQKVANGRWKPVSEAFAKLVVALTKQNQDIGKRIADAERDQARQVAEARRAVLTEYGRKTLDHLYFLTKAGEKVTEAHLADLKKTADELESLAPGSGSFHLREHARLFRLGLWDKPDPDAQQALADTLSATLVAKGSSANRVVQASFSVAEGSCYLFVGRFAKNTGNDKLVDFAFSTKDGRAALQTFQPIEAERGESFERGLCALKATTVTATAKVEFANPKNSLRWAALGWERAKFPADLALRISVDPVDHCDLGYWKSLWTQPIPGTLAWLGTEPFLLIDEEGNSLDLNGAPHLLRVEELSSKPSKASAIATAFKFAGCTRHGETVWTPESKALKQCTDPVDRKFQKPRADAVKLRGQPGNKAEEALAQVDRDYDAEVQKKCGALEAKAAKGLGELFPQLVEALGAHPTPDAFDRVGALQARLGVARKPSP